MFINILCIYIYIHDYHILPQCIGFLMFSSYTQLGRQKLQRLERKARTEKPRNWGMEYLWKFPQDFRICFRSSVKVNNKSWRMIGNQICWVAVACISCSSFLGMRPAVCVYWAFLVMSAVAMFLQVSLQQCFFVLFGFRILMITVSTWVSSLVKELVIFFQCSKSEWY